MDDNTRVLREGMDMKVISGADDLLMTAIRGCCSRDIRVLFPSLVIVSGFRSS